MPTPEEEIELIARMICLWVEDNNPDALSGLLTKDKDRYGQLTTRRQTNLEVQMDAAIKIWRALEDGRRRSENGQEPEPMEIWQAGKHV